MAGGLPGNVHLLAYGAGGSGDRDDGRRQRDRPRAEEPQATARVLEHRTRRLPARRDRARHAARCVGDAVLPLRLHARDVRRVRGHHQPHAAGTSDRDGGRALGTLGVAALARRRHGRPDAFAARLSDLRGRRLLREMVCAASRSAGPQPADRTRRRAGAHERGIRRLLPVRHRRDVHAGAGGGRRGGPADARPHARGPGNHGRRHPRARRVPQLVPGRCQQGTTAARRRRRAPGDHVGQRSRDHAGRARSTSVAGPGRQDHLRRAAMTNIPATIFRQYDVRGIVDRDLTPAVATALGRAYAMYVDAHGEPGAIAVGRDNRPSGPKLRDALVDGLTSAGRDVVDVGVVPTPLLYWSLHHVDVVGGIQITGSHNPPEYNGFKLSMGTASLHGDEIQILYQLTSKQPPAKKRGSVREEEVIDRYVDDIVKRTGKLKRPIRIVYDCGNGAGALVAPQLFEKLGVQGRGLFVGSDGTFPNHQPDPSVPENLEVFIEAVKHDKAEMGVAFDGDADRIGLVDDTGRIVWGYRILILYDLDVRG